MINEDNNIFNLTHFSVKNVAELYDLLVSTGLKDHSVLISTDTQYIKDNIWRVDGLDWQLNLEHLSRKGVHFNEEEEDAACFEQDHVEDFIFGIISVLYDKDLDTEECPIPALFHVVFNIKDSGKGDDFALDGQYEEALHLLAKKHNQKTLQVLTPEIIEAHREERRPLLFHDTRASYFVFPDRNDRHLIKVAIPEGLDAKDALESIKAELESSVLV